MPDLIEETPYRWRIDPVGGMRVPGLIYTSRELLPDLAADVSVAQVANVATEVETRTLGASIYQPALAPGRHSDVNPYFGIPAIPGFPFNGSALVVWDNGTPTPPTTNTPNNGGADPHSKPRSTPAARQQKSEFLKSNGSVVDVCGGAPCLAP